MSAHALNCISVTVIAWEALFCVALAMRLNARKLGVTATVHHLDNPGEIFRHPATTVGEINERYAALSETDPRLASELKYRDALALHGK